MPDIKKRFKSICDLSIVIPVYNDEEVLPELYSRLKPILTSLCNSHEIIFVDDGSKDRSFNVLSKMQYSDNNIRVIKLEKNYGQSNAIAAGMEHAGGNIIVIMDSDLQDRPEDIPLLMEPMIEYKIPMVVSKWITSNSSSFKQISSRLFCYLSGILTRINTEPRLGIFRAISRDAYKKVLAASDLSGTILSRFYALKLDYLTMDLHRDKRQTGKSSYTLFKLLKLAWNRFRCHSKIKKMRIQCDPIYKIEKIVESRFVDSESR